MHLLIANNSAAGGAPAGAFESIASITATGGETSLSFTSIPGTYQHLQIRGIARTLRALTGTDTMFITLNSDTGSNYSRHRLTGDGSTAAAGGAASSTSLAIINGATVMDSSTANIFAANIIDIHDYASTSKNTTMRAFSGGNGNTTTNEFVMGLYSGGYFNTSAITSISLENSFGFKAGSTFALYGIKGAA